MKHVEYVYVLYKAHLLWKLQCEAHARGEAFRPSNHFDAITPLPVEAQARIYRPHAAALPEMTLCLRHPVGVPVGQEALDAVARQFFADAAFSRLVDHYVDRGYAHVVYFTQDVPASVVPLT